MDEGHVHGHAAISSLSDEATDDDHVLTRGNEFLRDEAGVKSPVDSRQKSVAHGDDAFETSASGGHSFRDVVHDMRGLKTGHSLAVPWDDCLVEVAYPFLVFFHRFLLSRT